MATADIPSTPEKKHGVSGTQSVDRTLLLLELVADHGPISLQALCQRANLNRTTAWRLLSALEEHHFVERIPDTKEYDLGFAAALLCTAPQRRFAPLIRCAQPFMEDLMQDSQETVMLSVCHFDSTSVIYQLDPPSSVHLKDYINQPTPLWGTSNGKVVLAYCSKEEQTRFLSQPLTAFTPNTVVNPALLEKELQQIREDGYALVDGEWDLEENALAAPIFARGKLCQAAAAIGDCLLGPANDD